jgi:hypothetical protein
LLSYYTGTPGQILATTKDEAKIEAAKAKAEAKARVEIAKEKARGQKFTTSEAEARVKAAKAKAEVRGDKKRRIRQAIRMLLYYAG